MYSILYTVDFGEWIIIIIRLEYVDSLVSLFI